MEGRRSVRCTGEEKEQRMEAYFDNSATTRVLDKVVAAMDQMMTENYGNPSARQGGI